MPVHYKKGDVWFLKDTVPETDENGEPIIDSDNNTVMKEVAFVKLCVNDYIDQYKDNDWNQLNLNTTSATTQEMVWDPTSVYYKTGISNNAVVTEKPGKTSQVIYKDGNQNIIIGFKEIFNDIINNTATGDYSHAEGTHTNAAGVAAHAEGKNTETSGESSHTEGKDTQANMDASHAEGYQTLASERYAHAEGEKTKVLGEAAHAEGKNTEASGLYSHAEGYNTYAGSENFNESDINKTESEYLDTGGYCQFPFFASGNYDTAARHVSIVNPESEHYYWGYTSDSLLFTYAIKDPVNEDNYIEFSFNELSTSASPIFGENGNACAYIYQIDVDGSPGPSPLASPLPKELSYAYKYYRQEYEATNPTENQIKQVPIYIKNFKRLKTKIVDISESTPIGNISKLEGYHNFRLSGGGEITIKNGFEITFGKSNMKINKNLELYKIGDGYFRCVGDRDSSIARTLWMEPFLNGKTDYTNYTPKIGDRIQLVEIDTSISASEIFGTSNPVGISAHAEGQNTKASGIGAHAEGIGNLEITYHPIDNINKNFLGRIISLNKICLNAEINRKFPTDILFKLNDINFYFLTGEQEGETTSGSGYYLYNIKTISGVPADLSNEYELKIVMDENKAQGIGSHCEGIGTKALTAGSHSGGCYTTTRDYYQTVIGAANSTTAACGNNVIDMSNAYRNCYNLIMPVCGNNVINMSNAYSYCNRLTNDIYIKEKVCDISYCFYRAYGLNNIYVSNRDMSSSYVTNAFSFRNHTKNTNIIFNSYDIFNLIQNSNQTSLQVFGFNFDKVEDVSTSFMVENIEIPVIKKAWNSMGNYNTVIYCAKSE